MYFYDYHVLPHLINLACRSKPILLQRKKIIPLAEGRVLEIGMGSGLNIPFYNPNKIEFVWGLEPSEGMRRKAVKNLMKASFDVRWLDMPGEEIQLENNVVDTVVLTYTLCSIHEWLTALHQMRRVLKTGGKLVFCEHGMAPDDSVRKWQNRINPVWNKISGGCHLNRQIDHCLKEAGFKIKHIEI